MPIAAQMFVDNILPTFIVIAVGVLVDRTLHIDKKTLSRLAIYILTPALVLRNLSQSTVDAGQFGMLIVYVFVFTALMVALAFGVGKLLKWDTKRTDALVLSIAFLNAGNFGLSVALFAYGEVGFELAMVFFIASNLSCNTLAAFFAGRSNGGGKKALLKVFTLPGPYAFVLALIIHELGWKLPDVIDKPLGVLAGASVPIMLLMLGIQLSQTRIGKRYGDVALGVGLRLVVGALVAMGLAPLLGLSGLAANVAIVESATPTAISSVLMAIEFDADAEYVSTVIFVSTLASAVTLTVLLSILA